MKLSPTLRKTLGWIAACFAACLVIFGYWKMNESVNAEKIEADVWAKEEILKDWKRQRGNHELVARAITNAAENLNQQENRREAVRLLASRQTVLEFQHQLCEIRTEIALLRVMLETNLVTKTNRYAPCTETKTNPM